MTVERVIEQHSAAIFALQRDLGQNFDIPAQRLINVAFERMGIVRFDRAGNDMWERIVAIQNGWEYRKPPRHLVDRWAAA